MIVVFQRKKMGPKRGGGKRYRRYIVHKNQPPDGTLLPEVRADQFVN